MLHYNIDINLQHVLSRVFIYFYDKTPWRKQFREEGDSFILQLERRISSEEN